MARTEEQTRALFDEWAASYDDDLRDAVPLDHDIDGAARWAARSIDERCTTNDEAIELTITFSAVGSGRGILRTQLDRQANEKCCQ